LIKKSAFLILSSLVFALGCAAGVSRKNVPIELTTVENMLSRQVSGFEVRKLLGEPNQIRSQSGGFEIWLYYEEIAEGPVQKLSLILSKADDLVRSGTWIPSRQDSVSTMSGAFGYFKNCSFKAQTGVANKSHFVSDEVLYMDSQKGISVLASKISKDVLAISFEAPVISKLTAKDR